MAPRRRVKGRSSPSPPPCARPCTTRSACGSTKFRSPRKKSSRRCGEKRRASPRATDHRVFLSFRIRPRSRSSRLRRRNWILLRLPRFKYLRQKTAREAAQMSADLGPRAMFVAGGTDLFPKLKRRQFDVETLIGLDFLPRQVRNGSAGSISVDAGVTLAAAAREEHLKENFAGYADAAGLVSSPPLRNAGTIGGNLCVDTRCNYYDMTYEWRKAAGFCMKKDGDICLVAPSSPRCWAVSSSDTAPMAIALDGVVMLTGPDGERELPVSALYRDDGMDYMAKQPSEVVTSLRLIGGENTSSATSGASAWCGWSSSRRYERQSINGRDSTVKLLGPYKNDAYIPVAIRAGNGRVRTHPGAGCLDRDHRPDRHGRSADQPVLEYQQDHVFVQGWLLIKLSFVQAGQGMVEFALILALVALIVIVALLTTRGHVINLYSDIATPIRLYHARC